MNDKLQAIKKVGDDSYRINLELKPVDISAIDYDTPNAEVYFAINRAEDKAYTYSELRALLVEGMCDFNIHIGLKYNYMTPMWDDNLNQIVYKIDEGAEFKFLKAIGKAK